MYNFNAYLRQGDKKGLIGTILKLKLKEKEMNDSEFDLIKLILAPIAALAIPIIWNFASIPITYLRDKSMQKPSPVKIDLDLNYPEFENAQFKCLIVRYGTDEYIKLMANDQEKYDGRLRNDIIDIDYEDGLLHFVVPLHKRIGTQFKCFLETDSKEKAVKIIQRAEDFSGIYDLDLASSQHKNRVFFLLKDYGETKTVDGFKNNMIFPI